MKRICPSIITATDLSLEPGVASSSSSPQLFEGKSLEFDLCSEEVDDLVEKSLSISKQSHSSLPPVKVSHHLAQRLSKPCVILSQREFFIPVPDRSALLSESPPKLEDGCLDELPVVSASLSKLSLSVFEDSSFQPEVASSHFIFRPYRGKQLTRNVANRGLTSTISEQLSSEDGHPSSFGAVPEIDSSQSRILGHVEKDSAEDEPLTFQVHNRILGWKLTSIERRQNLIDLLEEIHDPENLRLKLHKKQCNDSMKKSRSAEAVHHRLSRRYGESTEKFLARSLRANSSLVSGNQLKRQKAHNLLNDRNIDQACRPFERRLKTKDISTAGDLQNLQDMVTESFGLRDDMTTDKDCDFDSPPRNLDIPADIHRPRSRMDIIESVRLRDQHRKSGM